MRISYRCNHPRFVATLAPLLREQWRFILTEETIESRTAKLLQHLNLDALPIAWIAHSEDEIFGTASLRAYDLEDREDLTPWLGGVYVIPKWRRRGIGAALCRAVEQKARMRH